MFSILFYLVELKEQYTVKLNIIKVLRISIFVLFKQDKLTYLQLLN